jgi:ABC-type phosphate transport system substrate-binding protein
MPRLTLLLMIHLLTAAPAAVGIQADDRVIVNPGVAIGAFSDEALKDIFLGRRTTWLDGSRVVVVVVLREGATHAHLLRLLDKNAEQFLIGWKKLVFTGRGFMPDIVDSEEALVALVARTPGAIGIVDGAKVTNAVRSFPLK